MGNPWEHPDWYDQHDTAHTAGSEREPEHYRELVVALPPLDRDDHLVDVGAGTGKLAGLIAAAYPRLGRVTLIDPNAAKLERAHDRLKRALPGAEIRTIAAPLGEGRPLPREEATLVCVGSVFMPVLLLRGGPLADGVAWLERSLEEIVTMLRPGGWAYALETVAPFWVEATAGEGARRLTGPEFFAKLTSCGLASCECTYRFRDRVTLRGRRPPA